MCVPWFYGGGGGGGFESSHVTLPSTQRQEEGKENETWTVVGVRGLTALSWRLADTAVSSYKS